MGNQLPEAGSRLWLTEAGIETYIEYKRGFDLPNFCLFDLLNNEDAVAAINEYFIELLDVAKAHQTGIILCGLHYRASSDWGALMGYTPERLAEINSKGVQIYKDLAAKYRSPDMPILLSGCIGPRGDAYERNQAITVESAEEYHGEQIQTLKDAGIDIITGLTLNSIPEAIGMTRAAQALEVPVVISFRVGDDACLQTGPSLREAIEQVDAATENAPAYYMINCAHPNDFNPALEPGDWIKRLNGIRPNASSLEAGVLCQLGHLEDGDPVELGQQMGEIAKRFPHISVWGGCCGTDARHIDQIARNVIVARG